MIKVWFIMEGERRKGPFSTENIQQLLSEGKISLVTMIKNQFVTDWKHAGDYLEFSSSEAEASQVELPVIPQEDDFFEFEEETDSQGLGEVPCVTDISNPVLQESSHEIIEEDDESLDFEFSEEVEYTDQQNVDSSNILLQKIKQIPTKIQLENTVITKAVLIAFIGLICGVSLLFLTTSNENLDLTSVNQSNIEELKKVQEKEYERKVLVAFSLNKKGTSLWASTNLKIDAQVFLEMKSIKGKVLSDRPIVFRSKALLESGMINFKDFKLDEGEKLVAGKYEIVMSLTPYGIDHKLANFFKNSFVGNLDSISQFSKTYEYRGEMLVYGGDSTNFAKQLKDYENSKLEDLLKFHIDRHEKYKTFISFVDIIKGMYLEGLNKMKSGKDVNKYIIPYGKNVAPILQDMIVDNHYKHEEFKSLDNIRAQGYSENFEYGKLVAAYASELSEMTKSKRRIGPRSRSILRKKANNMALKLTSQGQEYSSKLSAQIDTIRADFKKASL